MDSRRKPTATSNFGVGRRESHNSSDFYARFTPPKIDDDREIHPDPDAREINEIFAGNAASMSEVPDKSVALVVTSPPYFAGKEYETAIGEGDIPASYFEYLEMLRAVFAECVRKLEPGGRIAVNVANLGRKPYRSLSSDVIGVLEELGLLLRGEVIWQKARGSNGSCAWGSFLKPANPVFRDLTERVVIASKGRFDRACSDRERHERGLPWKPSLSKDEFMEATTDLWEIAPESATRVGHPAPFPVALPERLIHLYTYYGDLVLDPFMGSGTTAIAALLRDRNFVGYDTDAAYVERARERVSQERIRLAEIREPGKDFTPLVVPAVPSPASPNEDFQARANREGRAAKEVAQEVLTACGFKKIESDYRVPEGVEVNFRARDATGKWWYFDVSGGFTSGRAGLKRTDTLWKALGKASVLHEVSSDTKLVLLTTDAPTRNSAGDAALRVVTGEGKPIFAVIEMLSAEDQRRLHDIAVGQAPSTPS